MKFSRFERKILVAIVAAAVVPMVGALFLGQAALREAYGVGVNTRVGDQLGRGLELYQAHFTALRDNAEQAATAISHDHGLRTALAALDVRPPGLSDAGVAAGPTARAVDRVLLHARLTDLLDSYPTVAAVVVRDAAGRDLARAFEATRQAADMRMLAITRELPGFAASIEVTVAAPAAAFLDYQRAGELADVYSRLEQGSGRVSSFYLLVYMGFLASAIVLSVAMGIVLSRRVTRRVLLLADATRQVGQGDLSVQVPSDANDEVDELTRAFNTMVSDMRQSRDRIEYLQRIGAWQQFARHLAHEIKNPLTPIQLAVQEVNRSYRGDDEKFRTRLAEATSIVEEEVASLRQMVSEFSAFARLPEAALVESDLGDFLADAAPALEGLAEEFIVPGGPTLHVEVAANPTPLPVRIDAMMFRRGIDNLVRNALQALRDGGEDGTVRVSTQRSGPWAQIDVADDGPGIPEADLEHIFDPYFTTKTDGTGLGLPIVKKIVLEHNGEIEAGPGAAGGAQVCIRLPLLQS